MSDKDTSDRMRSVTLSEIRAVGTVLRLHDPYAFASIVLAAHPVPGYPEDLVAVVRYRSKWADGHRWALVQRVGPNWSATLSLSPKEATRRALVAVGKDPNDYLDAGGDGADAGNARAT